MDDIDLAAWVGEEPEAQRKTLRMAIHLVLRAIARSDQLAPVMIMKGGILLAIRYRTGRFTTDVDFSTPRRLSDVEVPALLQQMRECLAPVSAENEYELAIALQTHALKPPSRPGVTFPTLQMKIGYARKREANQMARLRQRAAARTVQIDYSFNEWASEVETMSLDGGLLAVYPLADLVAEKLRSVLQQPTRQRARFQDIYDLHLLLLVHPFSAEDRAAILRKLRESAVGRLSAVTRDAMRDPEVIRWSRQDYNVALAPLIASAPPEFEVAYGTVSAFYESLPWDTDWSERQ